MRACSTDCQGNFNEETIFERLGRCGGRRNENFQRGRQHWQTYLSGYPIEELVHLPFERVVWLVLFDEFPNQDQEALEMAMDVGDPGAARAFVQHALKTKQKIMGMGHREYRTVDPRAKILRPMAEQLSKGTEFDVLLQTLIAIEDEFRREMNKQQKDLWANVEYYKGVVFYALGVPTRFFTTLFAMSRTVGYLAHFLETRQDNRLIRPQALYTGRAISSVPTA